MLHYPRLMRFIYLLKIKYIISVDKVALPKAYVIHLFIKGEIYYFRG